MAKALFEPERGYYRARNPLGKNADFITAPEISQVFGELVAAYLLQVAKGFEGAISLVEMGAGRGVWFYDILRTIQKLAENKNAQAAEFISRSSFHIIEIGAELKKIQQEKLRDFSVTWHENFTEFLQKNPRPFLFISNEVFDCFPIDQFVKTDIGWCERIVENQGFALAAFNPATNQFVENLLGFEASQNAPFGAVFEHSETAKNFMAELCQGLRKFAGAAINFDYGYKKTEFANTLQALKNHQKVAVISKENDRDITAHVDFGALDKVVKNFGLNSSLILQRQFLLDCGIEERRKILQQKNPKMHKKIEAEINRLIAPEQMGELFKCHIIWK